MSIKSNAIYLASCMALFSNSVPAAEIAGVKLEDRQTIASQEFQLNGAGLRTKVFFKVYVAGLYVRTKSTNAQALLDSREPWRMRLQLLRDLEAEALLGALKDGLNANLGESDKAALAGAIEQFSTLMRRVGNARSGDILVLDYANDKVSVSFNGELKGSVEAQRFGRGLLSIWLGDHPVDGDLKKALLGG